MKYLSCLKGKIKRDPFDVETLINRRLYIKKGQKKGRPQGQPFFLYREQINYSIP